MINLAQSTKIVMSTARVLPFFLYTRQVCLHCVKIKVKVKSEKYICSRSLPGSFVYQLNYVSMYIYYILLNWCTSGRLLWGVFRIQNTEVNLCHQQIHILTFYFLKKSDGTATTMRSIYSIFVAYQQQKHKSRKGNKIVSRINSLKSDHRP